ncbi:HAMP domain-containing protein [Desulfotomaculum arcticum]|uniref:histidine kinase n=1 Tax=Desulfotruncus arcticus DSM 17038 TaxID=1121424 RepID=A0A1I2N5S5_9FIRM|nr:HAMP domain-containing sensor histidine kinase [Desulfotruncus arcticus]SFF99122.1 HAMP domain-containing protein [Desulfotomaculum arcticum] [Desulfotruncus arcticus DSM 17038]
MSLRVKLILLYSGVLSLVLLIVTSIIFIATSHFIYKEIDQGIAAKASSVIKSIKIENSSLFLKEVVLPDIDVFASPDTYLQIVDVRGKVLSKSSNLGKQDLPLSEYTLRSALRGDRFYETVRAGNQDIRVYNVPMIFAGQVIGLLQVGRTLSTINLLLTQLRFFVTIGSIAAVILAGIVGWFLARTALRPVERMIRTAASIESSGDLSKRIDYYHSGDELGRLADTLNAMFERLENTYHRLHESYEMQRRFVSDASHELRTPLTTIRGNAELLLKIVDEGPTPARAAINDIVDEARRLTRLVEDLLALARADAGYEFEKEDVLLEELIQSVTRKARFITSDKTLNVKNDCPSEIHIWGNYVYLSQLLFILLENAFKYSLAGSEVTLALTRKQNQLLEIAVADTGPGLPPGEEGRIFDRFYRGEHTRGKEGSGLGLAIARWVVEQHNGTITAANRQGGGCIFTVSLPMCKQISGGLLNGQGHLS